MAIKPVSVKQLNAYIKRILQSDPILGNVSVMGEISNFKLHGNGHVYFNLKDESSKVNCFLASNVFERLDFRPEEGLQVVASGYINIYERGGTYSLNIRDMSLDGKGNLAIEFEKLKRKLEQEGLFDQEYKKPIPTFPERIAIVTSNTGAAIQDMLKIIQDKNDYTDILIYPVLVQGEKAAYDIATAISTINEKYPEIDSMIIGRGGGSIEELWAFNEEIVARSIFDSNIPIISAVGHESDITISDFVADRRAETPTAAANMLVPDTGELTFYVDELGDKLTQRLKGAIEKLELRLKVHKMDSMERHLKYKIEKNEVILINLRNNIDLKTEEVIRKKEHAILNVYKDIESLNPKAIMERGYSALTDKKGKLINSAKKIKKGDKIQATLVDGTADLLVENLN